MLGLVARVLDSGRAARAVSFLSALLHPAYFTAVTVRVRALVDGVQSLKGHRQTEGKGERGPAGNGGR
jgi:hypothetical protein